MLPTVADYLKQLPMGIESYPRAQVKGAIVRETVTTARLEAPLTASEVPQCVADLAGSPPPVGQWIPEAYHSALVAAIYDLQFRESGGMAKFDAWVLSGKRRVVASPLYKVLFLVVSPERVLVGLGRRWEAFHQGSTLSVVKVEPGVAQVRLTYPERLFPVHALRSFGLAFQAAGEAAGARNVVVTAFHEAESSTVYDLSWQSR